MKTLSQTQQSSLQRLLYGAPLAESVGADFKRGTWTFKVAPAVQTAAGQYLLIPAIVAQLAVEQERCETQGAIILTRGAMRPRFSEIGGSLSYEASDAEGNEITMYRDHTPPERSYKWHPAHWYGNERRRDAHGRTWSSAIPRHVMDDFGDLVEVAA